MSAPRSELRTVLATQSPGKLPTAIGESVLELLRQCWHQVDGGGAEGMHAGKLERAEDLTWEAPVMTFVIERHGGTVLGSTRASLHRWKVDVEKWTAACDPHAGHRQLRRPRSAMHVGPVAEEVAQHIMSGTEHDALKWLDDRRRVRVLIGKVIADKGFKQTVTGRRRRFKVALRSLLPGWQEVGVNVWERAT